MNFYLVLNCFNLYNLVNFYRRDSIYRLLFLKYLNKKKSILRNSYFNNLILKKKYRKSFNIQKLREIFFENKSFAYCNITKKEELVSILKEHCAQTINNYINFAEKTINKEFSIFEKTYKFDEKINWFFSFNNNYFWKFIESAKIDVRPLDGIDVKYVWEFNRHQYFTYLGFAYYITNDIKYAEEFKNQILDWIKKNPPLIGINWLSGLEISLRLISWIFTLYFFKDCSEINNNRFFEKIFNSMLQHVYFLKHFHLPRSYNHTVGELFGIYFFSKIFQSIKPFKKWERKIFNKFIKHIILQIREDGTNIEQSVNYHRFVLEFFILFYLINSNYFPDKEFSLIEKSIEYLIHIIKPNKRFPVIGDNDDGKVLLLSSYDKNPYLNLINLSAIIFKRGDYKYFSDKITPISILLTGIQGFEILKSLNIIEPRERLIYYNKAGYIVIRNNFNSDSNYLFVDFGRFGPQKAGHSHSSITQILWSNKGEDIIIDSGTFSYNKSRKERNYDKSSLAHNILTINKKNQAIIKGWFSWTKKPKIKREIIFNKNLIDLSCFHDGYRGFIIKRKIISNTDINQIEIIDTVYPKQSFSSKIFAIDIYFHFNNNINLKIENNSIFINKNIIFEIISKEDFIIKIENVSHSPNYGFKKIGQRLTIHLDKYFKNMDYVNIKTKIKTTN